MRAEGEVDPAAVADNEKMPVTVAALFIDHFTSGEVAVGESDATAARTEMKRLSLIAMRFAESVTVTLYSREPTDHPVESQVNWAVVRSTLLLLQQPVVLSKVPYSPARLYV